MVIDDNAVIALAFLGFILAVTGGLAWFVLSRK
jgi:hypothetical protein